ncbi:Probable inorganic polyphosphate/ATP-NAD kinase [Providencia rettgeri]|uniref:Probable inorganic polyphosphate/ATP-NAD kinase n=1 Tax=Providencia rettgeri TaxID=587 RepID=A0A379FPR2_PRORE|nr:Probable inorganic polyphosphate/ATP-NAD kinase [Providencia rettgeri]
MRKDTNTPLPHFKTIGIVGHPRHPEALATHELIYHWLISKNYQAIIDKQVAKDLKLVNANTGTLTEIGQQADLVVVVGGRWQYARRCSYIISV